MNIVEQLDQLMTNKGLNRRMLGHKSVATTMDIYQSIFSEQKKKAAEIMNQFL